MNWVAAHWIEIFGTVTGLIYIWLEIKENYWLWIVGIISCSVYIYVFYQSKFYADMALQVYYVIISFYGLYYWLKGSKKEQKTLPISKTSAHIALILFLVGAIIFLAIGIVLDQFTDSPIPYWDSFTTTLGIVGTWMLARKYIEQWYLWIVADATSVYLYTWKQLYPTAFLYLVFTVLAIIGLIQWQKTYKLQNEQNQ